MASKPRRVVWAQSARDALDEAVGFVAERSLDGAERVLSAALEAAASLDLFSERGRVVPEIGDMTIREVFVFRFRLMSRSCRPT